MSLYHKLVNLLQIVVLQNGSMTKLLKKDAMMIQWLVYNFKRNYTWRICISFKKFLSTEFNEIDNKCKEGYPGVGEEYKMCRGVCKRDKPSTGEINSACNVSVTSVGIFFAMFLTLFL